MESSPVKIKNSFKKNFYELQAWPENRLIAGIDEVGRGCTFGCVTAAAVILYPHKTHRLLKDSKVLSQEELQTAYHWIIKNSWWATASTSAAHIDRYNIYRASQIAMIRALAQLKTKTNLTPSHILIDAMPLKQSIFAAEAHYFIKGESKSSSIAAASIVAKVTRDRIITTLSASFPSFGLEKHKGYSTAFHQQALKSHGLSFLHRKTFIHETDENEQQSLFF